MSGQRTEDLKELSPFDSHNAKNLGICRADTLLPEDIDGCFGGTFEECEKDGFGGTCRDCEEAGLLLDNTGSVCATSSAFAMERQEP